MGFFEAFVPMVLIPDCRSHEVPLAARASAFAFGAPNARRANGIVSTSFDVAGALRRAKDRLLGKVRKVPVYAVDRVGTQYNERLPRIWLSERVANTIRRDPGRVFVESYPTAPDRGGEVALELGDRYLGEGLCASGQLSQAERLECFKAAEILYLHAVRRGNREAASRLRRVYAEDLCEGDYWKTRMEERAKHARPRSASAKIAAASAKI